MHHDGAGVLLGLPDPFTATRYHSLAVATEDLPPELEVTARTDSGVIMALRHRDHPLEGVQFHPESVLTQCGHVLLANWLAQCGDDSALALAPALSDEVEERSARGPGVSYVGVALGVGVGLAVGSSVGVGLVRRLTARLRDHDRDRRTAFGLAVRRGCLVHHGVRWLRVVDPRGDRHLETGLLQLGRRRGLVQADDSTAR